jgi:hypothetical protein
MNIGSVGFSNYVIGSGGPGQMGMPTSGPYHR